MRVILSAKDHAFYKRIDDIQDWPVLVLLEKTQRGGPMTRRVACAELARRNGAEIVRRR